MRRIGASFRIEPPNEPVGCRHCTCTAHVIHVCSCVDFVFRCAVERKGLPIITSGDVFSRDVVSEPADQPHRNHTKLSTMRAGVIEELDCTTSSTFFPHSWPLYVSLWPLDDVRSPSCRRYLTGGGGPDSDDGSGSRSQFCRSLFFLPPTDDAATASAHCKLLCPNCHTKVGEVAVRRARSLSPSPWPHRSCSEDGHPSTSSLSKRLLSFSPPSFSLFLAAYRIDPSCFITSGTLPSDAELAKVKRNFERVSLLQRLEDHPYLRGDNDVNDDGQSIVSLEMPHLNLSDEERIRLIKLINGGALPIMERPLQTTTTTLTTAQMQPCQMPTTSAFNPANAFINAYGMKAEVGTSSFDHSVNAVAHGSRVVRGVQECGMQGMEAIRELFPSGEVLRRKTARRPPEEACKATCKVCGHEVMYSPQRTWNLMRHVWIMHQSSKPYQCSLCGFSHIKPYVRKHIESQHKQQNASIIDLKSPELEAEWHSLLEQCFGVTYRKWKHIKDESSGVPDDGHQRGFQTEHFSTDVMTNL
ncbi:unnamed protein product [Caenorhabditis auriculariae]|uniref:C2H2-type domain-containing protein n=1 Tax=Caenorhabditis auriculariae TaxID=2777116 RepID=A0A8S1HAX7_9PELO|nr:unnamed protein product [Caenorhabditis auriculariae]